MGVECNKDRSSDNAVGYRKIQYQQSKEGPNCTADLLKISGKIF